MMIIPDVPFTSALVKIGMNGSWNFGARDIRNFADEQWTNEIKGWKNLLLQRVWITVGVASLLVLVFQYFQVGHEQFFAQFLVLWIWWWRMIQLSVASRKWSCGAWRSGSASSSIPIMNSGACTKHIPMSAATLKHQYIPNVLQHSHDAVLTLFEIGNFVTQYIDVWNGRGLRHGRESGRVFVKSALMCNGLE